MIRRVASAPLATARRVARHYFSQRNAAKDPLQRRFAGGQLKSYPRWFLESRDLLLSERLLPEVCAGAASSTTAYQQLLRDPEYSRFDERIVEYSWLLMKLGRLSAAERRNLLDVGCVLNHKVVAGYIDDMVDMVWFMNPAPEQLAYDDHAAYILGDVRRHRLPAGLQIDVVTCMSTLEHVGMDTRRYGGPGGEINPYPEQPQNNAIEAILSMCRLLRPGGLMLLSVPYGHFEYLYDYGGTQPIYYTFDQSRLQRLVDSVPRDWATTSVEIYKVIPNVGWARTAPDDVDIPRYAEGCAAAGAVALIEVLSSRPVR